MSFRTSNYIHYVHLPEEGKFVLIHSYSGAVDKVSPQVVRFLLDRRGGERATHVKDEITAESALSGQTWGSPDEQEVEKLRSRGYLTTQTVHQERAYVQKIARWFHGRNLANSVPSFLLIPTYECNLRCPYCFETGTRVDLNKQNLLRNVMTRGRVDEAFAAIDKLLEKRFAGQKTVQEAWRGLQIGLFGGEPLQEMTRDVTRYIIYRARGRKGWVSAVTNAVDLHLFEDLMGKGLGSIQVTLDGPRDVHDTKRIGPQHRQTYDAIMENLKMAAGKLRIVIRIHTDWKSVDRTNEILEDLDRRGVKENVQTYVTPRHAYHSNADFPIFPNMSGAKVHEQMQLLPNPIPEASGANIESRLTSYVQGGLTKLGPGTEYCSATAGMHLFDPLGDVFACWEVVGRPSERIGTYSSEGIAYNQRCVDWRQRSPADIPECTNCKYVMFHFGGCAAMVADKDLLSPACNGFQDEFTLVSRDFFATEKYKNPVPGAMTNTAGVLF